MMTATPSPLTTPKPRLSSKNAHNFATVALHFKLEHFST